MPEIGAEQGHLQVQFQQVLPMLIGQLSKMLNPKTTKFLNELDQLSDSNKAPQGAFLMPVTF
jgi:hypothetical protein